MPQYSRPESNHRKRGYRKAGGQKVVEGLLLNGIFHQHKGGAPAKPDTEQRESSQAVSIHLEILGPYFDFSFLTFSTCALAPASYFAMLGKTTPCIGATNHQ